MPLPLLFVEPVDSDNGRGRWKMNKEKEMEKKRVAVMIVVGVQEFAEASSNFPSNGAQMLHTDSGHQAGSSSLASLATWPLGA